MDGTIRREMGHAVRVVMMYCEMLCYKSTSWRKVTSRLRATL
jgi:hypothetical protein